MIQSSYVSQTGNIYIVTSNDLLIYLDWVSMEDVSISKVLNSAHKNIHRQLDEYFKLERKTFNIPFKLNGTDFQIKVWQELLKLDYGQTISYSDIALNLNMENASRAVGSAVGRNPICILVPCHRVLPKNGKIGQYRPGHLIKEQLVNLEKSIN